MVGKKNKEKKMWYVDGGEKRKKKKKKKKRGERNRGREGKKIEKLRYFGSCEKKK